MDEIVAALALAAVGFGYVFFFLGVVIILLNLSSLLFRYFIKEPATQAADTQEDTELEAAAITAAVKHHTKAK